MDPVKKPPDPSGHPDQLRALGAFKGRGNGDRRPPVTWLSLVLWSSLMVTLIFILSGGF
ncbi:MAG: hypothetical protein QNI93_01605 [Kiloniellales bacterium]|nr:hypothetical protein [Kiloniellales bacterium]